MITVKFLKLCTWSFCLLKTMPYLDFSQDRGLGPRFAQHHVVTKKLYWKIIGFRIQTMYFLSTESCSGNVWYCYYSVTRWMVKEFELGGGGGNFRSFVHCCNQRSVCIMEENENLTSRIWTTMLQCSLRNYFHRTSSRFFQRIIMYKLDRRRGYYRRLQIN